MIPDAQKIYPRTGDAQTVYLKNVVRHPRIEIGDFTMYNDFVHDPRDFASRNVLYHYPVNNDRLIIGKFCSLACGVKFLFNSANHSLRSLSTYPFPLFYEEWGLAVEPARAWDNKGDIVIGNDVWIGYEAVVLAGVHIGDGAIVGARAVVTKDIPPYTVVGGVPAKPIRRRFADETVAALLALRWWDWPVDKISAAIAPIQAGTSRAEAAFDNRRKKSGCRKDSHCLTFESFFGLAIGAGIVRVDEGIGDLLLPLRQIIDDVDIIAPRVVPVHIDGDGVACPK